MCSFRRTGKPRAPAGSRVDEQESRRHPDVRDRPKDKPSTAAVYYEALGFRPDTAAGMALPRPEPQSGPHRPRASGQDDRIRCDQLMHTHRCVVALRVMELICGTASKSKGSRDYRKKGCRWPFGTTLGAAEMVFEPVLRLPLVRSGTIHRARRQCRLGRFDFPSDISHDSRNGLPRSVGSISPRFYTASAR
jgi:hypothetical protein